MILLYKRYFMAQKFTKNFFSCLFFFFACGFIYSQLVSRMVAIKQHAGLDDSGIGTVLFTIGLGSVVGFLSVGAILNRVNSRWVLTLATAGFCLLIFTIACVTIKPVLLVLFFAFGLCFAYGDVSMNVQALNLEQRDKETYMLTMHAFFSVGGIAGSTSGALFAGLDVGLLGNFTGVAAVLLTMVIISSFNLLPDIKTESSESKKSGKHFAIPMFVLAAAFMGLLGFAVEGSVGEWGSLVLHDAKGSSESMAALVYGIFCAVTASSRLFGDRLRKRVGDFRYLTVGLTIAFLGMGCVIFMKSPLLVLLSYALIGFGLAPLIPLLLSKVGHRDDIPGKKAATIVSCSATVACW